MTKKELEWYLNELYQSIITASCNFDIWWCFRGKENWDKYHSLFRRYPLYFRTSRHSYFRAIIIILYRLFENRNNTINFPHFLKILSGENLLKNAGFQECLPRNIYNYKKYHRRSSAQSIVLPFELRRFVGSDTLTIS